MAKKQPQHGGGGRRRDADLDEIVGRLTQKRVEDNLQTIVEAGRLGDRERILRLVKEVGEGGSDFKKAVSALLSNRDPGRAGYSYRLTVMRPGSDSPAEGYNLSRVRTESYGFEESIGMGYKAAGSLSTSFGGPGRGGGTILMAKVVEQLESEGVSKFWSRPNKPMCKVLDRLGYEEARLPKNFMDSEKKGGRTIYARDMTPMEVAYEYFRGLIAGDLEYKIRQGFQIEYGGLADSLDDWVRLRGMRVSQSDARKWLTETAVQVYGQTPARVNTPPEICQGVSVAAYTKAVDNGVEKDLRWVQQGQPESNAIEYHPISDLSYFAAYYLARGDQLRAEVLKAGASGQTIQTYRYLKDEFFKANEFGDPQSIRELREATKK